MAPRMRCELKSQYGHFFTHHGICTYRASGTSARLTNRACSDAAASVTGAQLLQQLCHGQAAMTDTVLALGGQFSAAGVLRFDPEQRVVTKTGGAAWRAQNAPVPNALAHQRRWIFGVAGGHETAMKRGRALGFREVAESVQQLGVVRRVVAMRASITGRVNSGCAA